MEDVFFASKVIKEVEEFCLTYFSKTTNMKDYFIGDSEEIRKVFRETMDGQFEHGLVKKSFSNQLESDGTVTLQQRIKCWMMFADRGGPIPNNFYDYCFGALFGLYRKVNDPEKQDLVK